MTTQTEARELAQRFGTRMCDENGDTHGEELYCLGLDDIVEMVKTLAQQSNEQSKCNHTKTITRADIDGNQIETTCGECGKRVAQQSNEQAEPVARYKEKCADGSRCLHGCLTNEACFYTHPPVPTAQPKEPEQEHVADREVLRLADAIELRVENKAERMVIADKLRKLAYTTPPQRKPMTDEMVLAGARALAKRHADSCGLDFDDVWKYYADEHKDDAKAVIGAAHGIKE